MSRTEDRFYDKAYELIFNQGQSHQEVYDDLVIESKMGPENVARTLSFIPTRSKLESQYLIINIFIIFSCALALTRAIVFFTERQLGDLSITGWVFGVLAVLFVPAVAIECKRLAKRDYFLFNIVLIISIAVRGVVSDDFGHEVTFYIILGLGLIIAVLSAIIPLRIRVKYIRDLVDKERPDGKIVKRIVYRFDEFQRFTRKDAIQEHL